MLFLGFFLLRVLASLCSAVMLLPFAEEFGKDNTTYPCVMGLCLDALWACILGECHKWMDKVKSHTIASCRVSVSALNGCSYACHGTELGNGVALLAG